MKTDGNAPMSDANRKRTKANATDYTIGYCKPPTHSQWRPGQCGYPQGRRKNTRNFKTDVKATLKAPVQVTRGAQPRKISTQEAMLLRLREKGLNGDVRALERMIQLAQVYNNEELASSVGLTVEDESVLRVYRARVLSGAADGDETESSPNGSIYATHIVQETQKPRVQIERYRPSGHKHTDHTDKKK
jgi:ribosomal protein L33